MLSHVWPRLRIKFAQSLAISCDIWRIEYPALRYCKPLYYTSLARVGCLAQAVSIQRIGTCSQQLWHYLAARCCSKPLPPAFLLQHNPIGTWTAKFLFYFTLFTCVTMRVIDVICILFLLPHKRSLLSSVQTNNGLIVGHTAPNASSVVEYLGIPYAEPPLRFAAPRKFNGDASSTFEASDFVSQGPKEEPSNATR